MSPFTTAILLSSLATGTIITATSFHWLMAWIGLELNTLAIIPLISKQHHPRATEAATKYFLTQAAASALILFSSTINAWQLGTWDIMQMTNSTSNILLTMALAMKLGLAPTHFWLPEVLQGTSMKTALIISTWQKLAPMALIIITSNNLSTTTLMILGMLSAIVGGWGGLNQTQTRKIMAYSSIAHLGWMSMITPLLTKLLVLNLIIYLLMTTAMFLALIMSKSKTLQDTSMLSTLSPTLMTLTMLTLLSLGGLPPLTGFIPKWLILQELTTQNLLMMATMLALSALLSLFFYLRLTYVMALTTPPNTAMFKHKWRFKYLNTTTPLAITLSLSIMLLPITPLIMT
uniref:NADH-ubiquinone oxidoreductase chain 2 n=1 Tax=Leiocephalus personatus TaxID=211984 RepID=A5YVS5_9SAUR|nr:NADH dehydrogenase subunit 2 [Leiocephalus personatus]ABQ65158.1 NADH dehydrogenase subunit 2 [Leiocephalus personatus]